MITQENISEVRKATGKVYQILTETMERYFDRKSLMYWTRLRDELEAKKTAAYKENNLFPHKFFDEIADQVLRWHWDKFNNIGRHQIKPLFQEMWQYHRKYLGVPLTDDVMLKFLKDGDVFDSEWIKQIHPYIGPMLLAIGHDLERRNPSGEEPLDANENQSGESEDESTTETT